MDRLQTLLQLREKGTLIRAAGGEPSAQSKMSRHLKELAQHFGCELVEKAGKSLRLTPAGEELSKIAASCFESLLQFHEGLSRQPKVVVIGSLPALVSSTLIPVLGPAVRLVEGCRVEVKSLGDAGVIDGLLNQKISLGLMSLASVPRGLSRTRLFNQKRGIIVPNRLVAVGGMLTLRRALLECPHAVDGSDDQMLRRLEALGRELGGEFRPALLCSSEDECLAAVRSGFFASVLPTRRLDAGEVKSQVVEEPKLGSVHEKLGLVWNKRHVSVNPHVENIRAALALALSE